MTAPNPQVSPGRSFWNRRGQVSWFFPSEKIGLSEVNVVLFAGETLCVALLGGTEETVHRFWGFQPKELINFFVLGSLIHLKTYAFKQSEINSLTHLVGLVKVLLNIVKGFWCQIFSKSFKSTFTGVWIYLDLTCYSLLNDWRFWNC